MAQSYNLDDNTTFQFEESSSSQYVEPFQPYDISYDEYFPIGSSWPFMDTAEPNVSTMPPVYEDMVFRPNQSNLESTQSQAPIPYHGFQSSDPQESCVPIYDYSTSFETQQVLRHFPKSPEPQVQLADHPSVIDENSTKDIPSKSSTLALKWEHEDPGLLITEESKSSKRRKATDTVSISESDRSDTKVVKLSNSKAMSSRSLEDCLGLFDTTLTATNEKRRRKVFSAHERKVVRSVRNLGACIPCKFRKKTCSAGDPCQYCARYAGSNILGIQMCHRESPFIERSLAQYYPNSSRRRILNFTLSGTNIAGSQRTVLIDGAGPINHPLCIEILTVSGKTLDPSDKVNVLRTIDRECGTSGRPQSLTGTIYLLKPGSLSTRDLEKWAVDYTSSYSKMKLLHANGFILGTEYVKKGLPHFDIVDKITRLVSINFVLRAGVTIMSSPMLDTGELKSPFRTIQAQIDTLLFESFITIEKSLYRDLQRLIFRSAGSLPRDAIIPVCFCVWQLARLQCMLASHLTNLAAYDLRRSRRSTPRSPYAPTSISPEPKSSLQTLSHTVQPQLEQQNAKTYRARQSEAESLTHGLNLLLCTFEALFRNACPLLIDWTDPSSKDLLHGDVELLALATKMGRTLRAYRARGHRRKFKLGFGYDKEMSGRIRGLLRER